MDFDIPEPLTLYDYQERTIEEAKGKLRNAKSLLIAAPTGSGKTIILSEMMARAHHKGQRSILLVHRQELVKQSEFKIAQQAGRMPGVVWTGRKEWDQPLTVLAQSTLAGLEIPEHVLRPDLLIIDEAHHTVAPSWLHTIHRLKPKFLIGFSATPFRQDKEPLSPNPFAEVIRPVTPQELIDRKILCPAIIESPIIIGPTGAPQPVNQAANLPQIYREAVRYSVANGRRKILLYVSQNTENTPNQVMQQTLAELERCGITTGTISQHHSPRRRSQEIDKFTGAAGASVLINYIALTEGTDLPVVDCVILGRNTSSESTIIQMIGRGLRRHDSKQDCLVLDYSGRKDMENIIHYWRLDEPKEPGASVPKQPEKKDPEALLELSVQFSKQISPWGQAQIEYPWFRPFDRRPLLALPLWQAAGQAEQYLTVEPLQGGEWRLSTLTLNITGPAPVNRRQSRAKSEAEALSQVRRTIGEHSHLLQRNAPWRMKPATDSQKKSWRSMRATTDADLTLAGEISDAIAKERFLRKVRQESV